MKVTILFVAVLAMSQALIPISSRKSKTILAELDSRPLGNMIMSQLQIHLASSGVVDDVVNMVDALIAELNEEQQNADRQHNQDVVQCEAQMTTTQAKHQQHNTNAQSCDETVDATNDLTSTAEGEVEEAIANIAQLERLIDEGTALRAQQAEDYARSMAKHEAAIDALTEAITIIGAFNSGGSFVQLKSKITKVTEDLQTLQHLQEFDTYGPIIESLVELSATTESDAVIEILDLLVGLRENIEKQVNEETALEEQRIASWNRELSTMTTQRNNAVNRKGVLETNIDNYHTIIQDNTNSAAMHREEEARFLALHENWQVDCDARFHAYNIGTQERQADLEVLGRLQEYLREQVGALEDYLMERVNV